MKIWRLAVLAITCAAVTACSDSNTITDTSWQVTDVYTTPDYPAEVPESIAGSVTVSFGNSTITGFTGCAPFNATVEFSRTDGDALVPSTSGEADHMRVPEMVSDEQVSDDCTGHVRFIHDALLDFFQSGEFTISRPEETEMIITVATADAQAVDQPAIRLAQ